MMKAALFFGLIATVCLFFADLEMTTLDPWFELRRMGMGALTPDPTVLFSHGGAFLNTLVIALCSIFLGIVGGAVGGAFFQFRAVRLVTAFLRGIHELFWAFLLLPLVGLNPLCAVLAIAIPYSGIFAKVFAEILEETDRAPLAAFPEGGGRLKRFFYGTLPLVYADAKNYTSYRFECALRSSTILGFVGLPTLGYHLETAFREGLYSEAAALLYAFYLLIASLKYWLKARWAWAYVVLAWVLISKKISFSFENIMRFLSYDLLPWPMRREGFLDGGGAVRFPLESVLDWFAGLWRGQIWPGLWQTVVLTQIALVVCGLLALPGFSLVCRHLHGRLFRGVSHYLLIVLRTTPEFILAYVFVLLLGPSMLPAIAAIALHNGAILAYLCAKNADLVPLRVDAPQSRILLYFYELLPRVYGQFLAFLFYRWEIMMREGAMLGLLGIYSLGFFIDSAIADDKMDQALVLIVFTALLNMAVDGISVKVRRAFKVSTRLMTRVSAA